jgi:ribosomal protein L11 methylase PrmA
LYEQIEKLNIDKKSNWNDYYKNCSYNEKAITEKVNFVKNSINNTTPGYILDIGCNEGFFSNVVKNKSSYIIAIDNDELVIERLYNNLNSDDNILPLIVDITNPSPSIGWENKERISFIKRIGTNNTTIALALIHHLRIFYNIPLENIAKFFAKFSKQLIIEFVPKTDVQTQKLLQNKADTYNDYTEENFVLCFTKYFTITEILHNNGRILYNMNRK